MVIGEGGSGGALGIGVGDRVAVLQHAYYSVISPEGCAGILWKSHEYAEKAAGALRFTSKDLLEFGIVDTVIQEPLGGAHRDPHQMAARLKIYLVKTLRELLAIDKPTLLQQRYEKFRRMGVFLEAARAREPRQNSVRTAGRAIGALDRRPATAPHSLCQTNFAANLPLASAIRMLCFS